MRGSRPPGGPMRTRPGTVFPGPSLWEADSACPHPHASAPTAIAQIPELARPSEETGPEVLGTSLQLWLLESLVVWVPTQLLPVHQSLHEAFPAWLQRHLLQVANLLSSSVFSFPPFSRRQLCFVTSSSLRKAIDFQFVCFFLPCCKDSSDEFQALHVLEFEPETCFLYFQIGILV